MAEKKLLSCKSLCPGNMLIEEWRHVIFFLGDSLFWKFTTTIPDICVSRKTRKAQIKVTTSVTIKEPVTRLAKNIRQIEPYKEEHFTCGLLEFLSSLLDTNYITHLKLRCMDVSQILMFTRKPGFRNVRYLSLASMNYVDDVRTEEFLRTQNFRHITHLDLFDNDTFEENHWEALASNSSLKNLTWLNITDCEMEQWTLSMLIHTPLFHNLRHLKARDNYLGDESLYQFPNTLDFIDLGGNGNAG